MRGLGLTLGLSVPLFGLALGGCYQALTPGYTQRFGEGGGPAFEGQYVLAVGDMSDLDLPSPMGKVAVSTGEWGLRVADVIGLMVAEDMGDVRLLFRPGIAFLVIGSEKDASGASSDLYFGLGLEADLGLLVPLDEDIFVELGVRGGGDLGYTGEGTAAFAGIFLGVGWMTDAGDFTR